MKRPNKDDSPTESPGESPVLLDLELQQLLDSRRAALNLMEDAVQAQQAIERLNEQLHKSEERQTFLLTLSDALRSLTASADIAGMAAECLGERFALNRVCYAKITGTRMTVEREYARDVSSLVGVHNLEAFGPDMLAAYRFGAVIVVNDVGADPRLTEEARAGLQARQVGAYVDVVLFEEEQRLSLLTVQSATPRNWTAAEQSLFREVGERLKSAIERARAEEALRQSEDRLRSFAGQLERLVDERTQELVQSQTRLRGLATELNLAEQRERKRLSAELHDYLAQLLVLGCLKLGQVRRAGLPSKVEETVKETEEVLTQALNYSRTLMAELSPSVLQEHGLPAGLKWLGEQMQRQGLTVRVEVGDVSSLSLTNDCALLLFQSVRELLMNALKHAGCQHVDVRLQDSEDRLRIEVRDEGVGFDLAAAGSSASAMSSKFGHFSIRERMMALGGWFDLQSAPGEGTTATLVLPLAGSAESSVLSPELSRNNSALPSRSALSTQHSALQQDTKAIRVLLVDDHAMVRQGLRSLLDSYIDIDVVGEAWDGAEAVAATDRLRPSIIIMDINMPKMNGIEATAHIKARHPDIIVIGLSVNTGDANETAMKRAGAALLLTKEAAVDELYHAIQQFRRPSFV